MDLATINTQTKTNLDEAENETPPKTQLIKAISTTTTNGSLKKHHQRQQPAPAAGGTYKQCLKNHAASLGGHALDGCGEFMPSPTATHADPTSLKCAACGCHRNFHRREPEGPTAAAAATRFIDFHHYPLRRSSASFSSSPSQSPPPPPQPNYSFAPNMLLALSTAVADEPPDMNLQYAVATPTTPTAAKSENPSGRKRFRTKFSQEQKERMTSFAEKLGWKMQRCEERMVESFCSEVGIRRGVFKVWMHNNKSKRDIAIARTASLGNSNGVHSMDVRDESNNINLHQHLSGDVQEFQVCANGSSSSS
ncbi:hypothetical protein RJ640_007870 [Escallonia rubra]|uniref:ZF-HD dimerization-type domain-containing protein n=1 Tax=Escallonia rubra TaxID=112253 RepID=A0AA88QTE4_9ASTE|nr:hypothetical protein RJ640_007870 [Escallonia rubra]